MGYRASFHIVGVQLGSGQMRFAAEPAIEAVGECIRCCNEWDRGGRDRRGMLGDEVCILNRLGGGM